MDFFDQLVILVVNIACDCAALVFGVCQAVFEVVAPSCFKAFSVRTGKGLFLDLSCGVIGIAGSQVNAVF